MSFFISLVEHKYFYVLLCNLCYMLHRSNMSYNNFQGLHVNIFLLSIKCYLFFMCFLGVAILSGVHMYYIYLFTTSKVF